MDQGAGKHGSESPSLRTRATEVAAEVAANAMSKEVPHASRNLLHFLGNSGKPLAQDVDQMMKDIPGFARTVEENQNNIGKDAIADAKAHGVTQPVTYPINTAWDRYKGVQNESRDWFLAVGDFSFNQTGQVTVYPPAQPGGEWRYEMNTQVNMRDQYNWDGQKSTQIGPLTVTDKELADMHRGGIAQEFLVFGASTPQATEGHGE
jgi:hypothetical protein